MSYFWCLKITRWPHIISRIKTKHVSWNTTPEVFQNYEQNAKNISQIIISQRFCSHFQNKSFWLRNCLWFQNKNVRNCEKKMFVITKKMFVITKNVRNLEKNVFNFEFFFVSLILYFVLLNSYFDSTLFYGNQMREV